MKAVHIAHELDLALRSGQPQAKLEVLELANEYDQEGEKRSLGLFVLDKFAEAYENTPGNSPIKDISVSGFGIGANWLTTEDVRPFTAVEVVLGSSFGVSITKPSTKAEYLEGAIQIRAVKFDSRTVLDRFGPDPRPLPLAADYYAREGQKIDAHLLVVDYKVHGTPHFMGRVATITTITK